MLAALAVLLLAPAGAAASSVSVSSGTLTIVAADGEANAITITGTQIEDRAGIAAGEGCAQRTATVADCGAFSSVFADLGDGDDSFVSAESASTTVYGGRGSDSVQTGPGRDLLRGDSGADVLAAGAGDDEVHADDARAEQVDCGDGKDTGRADDSDELTACEAVTQVATPFGVQLFAERRLTIRWLLMRGYGGGLRVSHPGELRMTLTAGRRRLAGFRGRVEAAGDATWDLVLRRRHRAWAERRTRIRARLVVEFTSVEGDSRRLTARVVFVRD